MRNRCLFFSYRFILTLFFLSSAFTLFPSVGLVEEARGAKKFQGSEPGWSTFLRGGYVHQFDGDLDGGAALTQIAFSFRAGFPMRPSMAGVFPWPWGMGLTGMIFQATVASPGCDPGIISIHFGSVCR